MLVSPYTKDLYKTIIYDCYNDYLKKITFTD